MKELIKNIAFVITSIAVFPAILLFYLLSLVFAKDGVFSGFSQFFSLFPGTIGVYCRASFYRFTMQRCHKQVYVGFGSLFAQVDTEIGKGVYIGPQCNIGMSMIGDDCLFGSGVHVLSGKNQHFFGDLDKPIREQGGEFTKIRVGNNCWFGNNAVVMANVGDNCIVAAGAVVVNDVPNNTIVGGNPAKVLGTRN